MEHINHSLELDEQPELHRKGFLIQLIGKILIIGFVMLGLLGLFGQGLLSIKTVRKGTAVVQYERFAREEGKMQMHVSMTSVAGRSAISFPLNYIRSLRVEQIVPEPELTFIRDGQVWYVFEAEQNLQADFYLQPRRPGNIHSNIWVNDQNIPLHHLIYP